MASSRLINKAIYTNAQLGELDINIRYFYKALIVHADDEGRLRANTKHLKALIFPFDEGLRTDTLSEWLEKLQASGLVCLYAVGGKEYLYHPNWKNWQTIRGDRFKPSDCPCPQNVNQMTTRCQPSDNQMATNGCHLGTEPNLTKPNLTKPIKDPPENLAGFSKEFVEKAEKAKALGFNIYQLSGSFYKQSNLSDKLPEAVLSAVLDEFEKRGESVEEHWPYFLRVLQSKSAEYFANKNIQDSVKFNDKFAFSVAEILAGMAKH